MSRGKKTPVTTSTSTPPKSGAQQLLNQFMFEVLHNALRSFQQQPPTTTLLMSNQSSPIIPLSRISTPVQGTVKLAPALPLGELPEGEQGRELPPLPMSSSPKGISEESVTITDSGFGP